MEANAFFFFGGSLNTDFGRIHDDGRNKVKEDVVAVCADTCVAEGHLQFIHGLQEESFSLILKVFKGGFLAIIKGGHLGELFFIKQLKFFFIMESEIS